MAFNFQRLKQWLGYENITNSDLNSEFNNILTKAGSDTLSSANSTNNSTPTVPSMQQVYSPGTVGSEVLAQTTQQDIQQIRYMLNSIIGGSYWYSSPASTIAQLNSALNGIGSVSQSRIISGAVDANSQPMFLLPSGSTNSATLKATSTNFNAFFNGASQTFTSDITITGLTAAPSSQNTATINDSTLSAQQFSKTVGERDTQLTISSIGSNITALNGLWAGFKVVHSATTEYFIGLVDTSNNRIRYCYRGFFFNSSGNTIPRLAISNSDTITLMKLAWIFATYNSATPGLDVCYTNPVISGIAPSSPATGDYFYDLTANTWKKFNGTSYANTTAVLVGIALTDSSSVTQAARSFDFANLYTELNSIELEKYSNSVIQSTKSGPKCSIYGSTYAFDYNNIKWDTSSNMDTGETISANTYYYLYLANNSKQYISSVAPHLRKFDLRGDYHPSKPWRCVGQVLTDGSNNFLADSVDAYLYNQKVLPVDFLDRVVSHTHADSGTTIGPGIATWTLTDTNNDTATIPLAILNRGRKITVKLTATTASFNTLTLNRTGGDTFSLADGTTGATSLAMQTGGETYVLQSDGGTVWQVINHIAVTPWASYTPTITGFGTAANVSCFWKRRGDTMFIQIFFESGTPSGSDATVSLPGGLSMDTAKLSGSGKNLLGLGTVTGGSQSNPFVSGRGLAAIYYSGSGATVIELTRTSSADSATTTYEPDVGTNIASSGSQISIGLVMIPISGWKD